MFHAMLCHPPPAMRSWEGLWPHSPAWGHCVLLCGSSEGPFLSLTPPPGSRSGWRKVHLFGLSSEPCDESAAEKGSLLASRVSDSLVPGSPRAGGLDERTLYKGHAGNTQASVCSRGIAMRVTLILTGWLGKHDKNISGCLKSLF